MSTLGSWSVSVHQRLTGTAASKLAAILLVCFSFISTLNAQSWSNGYTYRRTITIDHTKVPNTDQTNFPVLISGTYSYLASTANGGNVTNSSGYDIIFTSDASGSTLLPFEQENYSATTGALNYWVQVPTVSHSADTVIYMFYGKSSVTTDQSNKTGVWDSNFKGVWHFPSATTLNANDSTSNANNATVHGTTATTGRLGGGSNFVDESSQYLDIGSNSSLNINGPITMSAWVRTYSDAMTIIGGFQGFGTFSGYGFGIGQHTSGKYEYWSNYNAAWVSSNSTVNDGYWHQIAVTVNGTMLTFYKDGAPDGSPNSQNPGDYSGDKRIGVNQDGSGYFNGVLDEVRISSGARSADWMATEFNNENSPTTFYGVGNQQQNGGGNGVADPTFDPLPGGYISTQGVTISTSTPGATIRYTLDGSTPSETVGTIYTGQITVSTPTTIKAIAYLSGTTDSAVISASYLIGQWSNGYSYRRTITIDHTKVPNTDQTNFPVLISETHSYLATTANGGNVTNSSGYDIIFTSDASGATLLPFEQENYSATTGAVNYWVKIPTLSHTSDTVIYMFYGNSSVTTDQSHVDAAWDSNFKGVWHFPNGTTLSAKDSTADDNHGSISGPTAITGQIGGGGSFTGTANYIEAPAALSLDQTTGTFSIWFKTSANGGVMLSHGTNSSGVLYSGAELSINGNGAGNGKVEFILRNTLYTPILDLASSLTYNDNNWHYAVAVWDASNTAALYVDGSLVTTGTPSGLWSYDSGKPLRIGQDVSSQAGLVGSLDEPRLSSIKRSADWIQTEFNNQNLPGSFYSVGQANGGPGGIGGTVSDPIFSPSGGTYATPQSVRITTSTPGAVIRYTTDGSNPSETQGTLYTGSVSVSSSQTIKAIAYEAQMTASNVVSAVYNIVSPPNITNVSPNSGVPGTQVTITGTGFGASQGSGQVLSGTVYGVVQSWSDTQVVALVANGSATGNAKILQNHAWSNAVAFTVNTPHITGVSPAYGYSGTSVTITGSGFGALQGSGGSVQLGSMNGQVSSWSDTQVIATIATGALSGVARIQQNGVSSNAVSFIVPASNGSTMTLAPSVLNLIVGDTHSIQALNSTGQPITGLTWTSSDTNIVSLSTADPPVLTALAAGHATITAAGASADVTVSSGPLPLGTVTWSNPGDGSGVAQIIPAVPSPSGVADVFAIQNDGSVQAIASDGTTAWTATSGVSQTSGCFGGRMQCDDIVPDFQGGFAAITADNATNIYITKIDGITGQAYSPYTIPVGSAGPHSSGINSLAIHPDGTIFVCFSIDSLTQNNTIVEDTWVAGIDPTTGTEKFKITLPNGANSNGVFDTIVAGDGYAYMPFKSHDGQTSNYHLKMLRVNSSGNYNQISILDWTGNFQDVSTGFYVPPSGASDDMVSNGADGVLFSWWYEGGATPVAHLTTVSSTGMTDTTGPIIPGQNQAAMNLVLQRQDGSFLGIAYVGDPQAIFEDLIPAMVAFDANGNVLWSVQNEIPQIATDDGGVIGQSGIIYDQNGNAAGQAALPIYSWNGNAYQQQGSIAQINDDLLFVRYDLASSFWPIVGGNYSDNETAYALVRTFQDNVVNADVFVTNPSQTNPNQQTITNVLNTILQALNSGSYGGCSAWLTGTSSFSASTYIGTLITEQNYGHGTFNDNGTAAFVGTRNLDGTLVGVPVNYAFTVNDQGAFFNAKLGDKTFTVSPHAYAGGTLKAQAEILIHELAHKMNDSGGASGFQPDAGNKQAGRANEKLLDMKCGTLIRSLR